MPAVLKHITDRFPQFVPVLIGAPEVLVAHRELRNVYETNRSIKTWACWFMLKSITTSGKIQHWRNQRQTLLPWLKMEEKTFYTRLNEMIALQLITLDGDTINLISYEKAAQILDIPFCGLTNIQYNPKIHGKQVFQYLLRAEEFRFQQERQLNALLYHLGQNPSLKNDLHVLLVKFGADGQRLYDGGYFQERLLALQMHLFKEGSEILQYVLTHRADINRSVTGIQHNHSYKGKQSVTYLKRRMSKLGIITVEKKIVQSKSRSRLYVPDAGARGGKRDGYKYVRRTKATVWFLTDQIQFKYEVQSKKTGEGKARKAA